MTEIAALLAQMSSSISNLAGGRHKDAHIELLKSQVEELTSRTNELEQLNQRLVEDNRQLREALEHVPKQPDGKRYKGAIWPILPDGTYEDAPKCLKCGLDMVQTDLHGLMPTKCSDPNCGTRADFNGRDRAKVLQVLNART